MPPSVNIAVDVKPIIGLEIHVQLATGTKMFCGCALEFGAPPNTRTCPVCLGLPGALPVANRHAVELAIRTGVALNCRIAPVTRWDRKSYFYPDLPKNYQISQLDQPIAQAGLFEFPLDGRMHRVRIRRAHLEEDAGKNVHDFAGVTAVDLNRAGAPLLEIVTEPDLDSAEAVRECCEQMHRLVRYLGVSEANMQQGQMRFEPNINLRVVTDAGEQFTPIVEVKNLNSFRSVYAAVEHEIRRQFEAWQTTGQTAQPGNKTNRGWDDQRLVTVAQREKEESHDYRYFPDPDLPPVNIPAAWVSSIRHDMPELPIPRTERFVCEYKLPPRDAPALVNDRGTADLLDRAADAGGDKVTLGKQFMSIWAREANLRNVPVSGLGIGPRAVAELSRLAADGEINATAAARVAEEMARAVDASIGRTRDDETPIAAMELPSPPDSAAARRTLGSDDSLETPRAIAQRLGLLQSRNEDQIAGWVRAALDANPQAVADARSNPKKRQAARGFLTGQVMKLSGGQADPKIVGRLIDEQL